MNRLALVLGILLCGYTALGRSHPLNYQCSIQKGDINHDHKMDEVLSCSSRNSERHTKLIILLSERNTKFKNLVFDQTGVLDFPRQNGAGFVIRDIWATIEDGHLTIVVSGNSHADFMIRYGFVFRNGEFVLADQEREDYLYCNPSMIAKVTKVNFLPLDIKLTDFCLDCLARYGVDKIERQRIVPRKILRVYKRIKKRYSKKLALRLVERGECPIDEFMRRYLFLDSQTHVGITEDIAHYLQKAGAYREAIYLLERIAEAFPDHENAYIDLGDAYWALGEREKARQAYRTYLSVMHKKGVSKKIPKKIFHRLGLKKTTAK